MVNRHKRALLVNKSHNANARTRADDFMRENIANKLNIKCIANSFTLLLFFTVKMQCKS